MKIMKWINYYFLKTLQWFINDNMLRSWWKLENVHSCASLHYQSEKDTKLSLVTSPNVSFPSKQRRTLTDTAEEAKQQKAAFAKFCAGWETHQSVTDDNQKRHRVPVHALWKHAVRRKTWFRGTISFWCWANIQSYLQLSRTDSSPDIDFSAQTLDKQSLCDLQITLKKKKTAHDTWWTLKRFRRYKKKIDVDMCTFCTMFFAAFFFFSNQTWHHWYSRETWQPT